MLKYILDILSKIKYIKINFTWFFFSPFSVATKIIYMIHVIILSDSAILFPSNKIL